MNQQTPTIKRIMRECKEMKQEPSPGIIALPLENNLFEWHFTILGVDGTEFENGRYHGKIILPSEYPFKPPDVIMLNKSGRFEIGKKICLNFSGFHPEYWQPSWTIRTMLVALRAFMVTPAAGAVGAIEVSAEQRKLYAKQSAEYKCPQCNVQLKDLPLKSDNQNNNSNNNINNKKIKNDNNTDAMNNVEEDDDDDDDLDISSDSDNDIDNSQSNNNKSNNSQESIPKATTSQSNNLLEMNNVNNNNVNNNNNNNNNDSNNDNNNTNNNNNNTNTNNNNNNNINVIANNADNGNNINNNNINTTSSYNQKSRQDTILDAITFALVVIIVAIILKKFVVCFLEQL